MDVEGKRGRPKKKWEIALRMEVWDKGGRIVGIEAKEKREDSDDVYVMHMTGEREREGFTSKRAAGHGEKLTSPSVNETDFPPSAHASVSIFPIPPPHLLAPSITHHTR